MVTLVPFINGILPPLGVGVLICFMVKFLRGSFRFVGMYFTKTPVDYKGFGEWALVTGATDGIGKEMATGLAKRGLNIILVSRNENKLIRVAGEIEKAYSVSTKYVVMEFSNSGELIGDQIESSSYDAISDCIDELEVGILVNNIGIGAAGEFLHPFAAHPNESLRNVSELSDIIYCNDLSMAMVTALVLPQMVRRQKGLVINISSIIGSVVAPNVAMYASSKTFNDTFTMSLHQEYKDKGIIFQSVQPGVVKTKLTMDGSDGSFLYPECGLYVQNLLECIGKEIHTTGYHLHGLLRLLVTSLPEWFVSYGLLRTMPK